MNRLGCQGVCACGAAVRPLLSFIAAEGDVDSDDNGLRDAYEGGRGTDAHDAHDADSDDDGDSDGDELSCGSSPLDPFLVCPVLDSDDDGPSDADEAVRGTDPADADSDDDGEGDGAEVDCGSSPLEPFFPCADPPTPGRNPGCGP